jgi:hypothetical protein
MKEFLSFRLLGFTHVLPDVTNSKLYEDSMFGNSVWHCVYNIYDFIAVKELETFCYVLSFPSHGN